MFSSTTTDTSTMNLYVPDNNAYRWVPGHYEPYNPYPGDGYGAKPFSPTDDRPCAIEEFFRQEQKKPWWMRSSSCLLYCNCPKCRITC
jgi:hypothetical protein